MLRRTHLKKILMLSSVGFIVALAFYGYIFYLFIETSASTRALERDVYTKERFEEQNRELVRLLETTDLEREALFSFFLEHDELVAFIEHVETLGRVAGVSLDTRSVEIEEVATKDTMHEWLSLSVLTEGSWEEVYHFLSLLERAPLALSLVHAEMKVLQGEENLSLRDWSGRFDFRVLKDK